MADEQGQWLVPTEGARTLPAIEILTGRGFVTGKSGSGKSNTGSVIAEGLLENNYNLLVVDPEGEYYGLKERFEILHVGNDDLCDVQVSPGHAEQLADIALEQNMPIILDVSDYLDGDEA
ncbi:ATP-binding protein, partial [Halobacteriales archaeon QS_1_69_70]